jgi:DNA-binding NtrC family response regulator
MAAILMLDDRPDNVELIGRIATESEQVVLATRTIEEFQAHMARQSIDLAIISLGTVGEQDILSLQTILGQYPGTKVLALVPAHQESWLATLLRAESLRARHLLATPINSHQLRAVFDLTFPQPAQQE